MIQTEYVLGNTGCLHCGGSCIPFYQIKEGTWILMDSGPFSIRGELDQYLKKHGIEIRAVLCSHAHFDQTIRFFRKNMEQNYIYLFMTQKFLGTGQQ